MNTNARVEILPFITHICTFLNKKAPLDTRCIDMIQYQFRKNNYQTHPVTKINSPSSINNIMSYHTNHIISTLCTAKKVSAMGPQRKLIWSESGFFFPEKCHFERGVNWSSNNTFLKSTTQALGCSTTLPLWGWHLVIPVYVIIFVRISCQKILSQCLKMVKLKVQKMTLMIFLEWLFAKFVEKNL